MRILAVIVTYKRPAELSKTIQAIKLQDIKEQDILVVNNAEKHAETLTLASLYKDVQWHHLPENIASAGGFAYGLNKGLDLGYDWVWLFNDDSRPKQGCLASVESFLLTSRQKADVGFIKISEKVRQDEAVLLYWKGVRKPKYVPLSDVPVETDLITFDGCFISSALMNSIGFCDEKYFMGTYEFEYCLRAKDAGFKIYTLPNGMIEDEKKGAVSGTPPWRQYYNTRNHLQLALNRRSMLIFNAWLIREIKYTLAIIIYGNNKFERLVYKARAIRDGVIGKRGKTYHPDNLKRSK